MRQAALRLWRGARAIAARLNKATLFTFALGALCGMAGTREFSPFGAAAVAGVWLSGGCAAAAFAGAALSTLLLGQLCGLYALCSYALISASFALIAKRVRPRHKLALLPVAELLALPLTAAASAEALMLGGARLALSPFFAAVFYAALRATRGVMREGRIGERQALALCAALGVLCLALSRFSISGISAGEILTLFVSLFAAGCAGICSVVAAALCAAFSVLGGSGVPFLGASVLFALAATAARRLGRYGACGCGIAMALLCARYLGCGAEFAVEAGLCCAIYLALPKRLPALWAEAFAVEKRRAEAELSGIRDRVSDTAEVLVRVSALLEESPQSEAEQFAGRQLRCMSSAITALPALPAPPRYAITYGAASLPRAKSPQSGDSIGVRDIEGGKLIILSDGMGSGPLAHRESAAAAALMGDLLTIGVEEAEALECVNRLLMFKGEYDMYVTMDAMRFDYSSGAARFLKLGAPPSYVMKGSEVLELCAETLPVGIVEAPAPARKELTLGAGDAIVMMTDGVSDALGEEVIPTLAEALELETPERAAQELVKRAALRSRGDDMSVVVARVRGSGALPL